jgi:hypothetical protein
MLITYCFFFSFDLSFPDQLTRRNLLTLSEMLTRVRWCVWFIMFPFPTVIYLTVICLRRPEPVPLRHEETSPILSFSSSAPEPTLSSPLQHVRPHYRTLGPFYGRYDVSDDWLPTVSEIANWRPAARRASDAPVILDSDRTDSSDVPVILDSDHTDSSDVPVILDASEVQEAPSQSLSETRAVSDVSDIDDEERAAPSSQALVTPERTMTQEAPSSQALATPERTTTQEAPSSQSPVTTQQWLLQNRFPRGGQTPSFGEQLREGDEDEDSYGNSDEHEDGDGDKDTDDVDNVQKDDQVDHPASASEGRGLGFTQMFNYEFSQAAAVSFMVWFNHFGKLESSIVLIVIYFSVARWLCSQRHHADSSACL